MGEDYLGHSLPEQKVGIVKQKPFLWRLFLLIPGLFTGIVGGIFLIFIGLSLSATIIGAIIGIPILLFGIGLLFGSPAAILGEKTGICPYCGKKNVIVSKSAINCRDCKKRLLVRGKKLILVD